MVQTARSSGTHLFSEMLDAAKLGEDWAWDSLYRGLSGNVTGYLASRGAADPDDLAAEVFLQLARDIHRFEGDETSFRSWVFVVAHRRLIDARRSASRRPSPAYGLTIASDEIPGGNVESETIDHLALAELHTTLDGLTDDQRNVLAMRVIADLTLAETANALGKRVGAVKALQRRALQRIREQIEKSRVTFEHVQRLQERHVK